MRHTVHLKAGFFYAVRSFLRASERVKIRLLSPAEPTLQAGEGNIMDQFLELTSLVKRLNQIGIALSAEHNLGRLLEMIVTELRSFTRSDGGSLYIIKGDSLSFEVAQNDTLSRRMGNVPFKSFTIPIDKRSIAGYVAVTGNPVNIPDIDQVDDSLPFGLDTMKDFDRKNNLKTVSVLGIPMRNHKEEIIGVVQLFNSLDEEGQPVPYASWMVELVTSLASQAAVAISNSMLIRDIKNLFESLVTYSAQAIDARSPHTAGHSKRVAALVMKQAETVNRCTDGKWAEISFDEGELDELRMASWLHDIGKIGVKENVLDKVNKLSDGKISAIIARFMYMKKEAENRGNLRKLELTPEERLPGGPADAIEDEVKREIQEIGADLELILRVNKPGFLSIGDYEWLKRLADKVYHDPEGNEHPYLEPFELEHLEVRKGNLTASERAEIQSHVRHSMNILEKIPFTRELQNIPSIASAHHEFLDGSGYPVGLKGEEIALQSRMITVADIYEALVAKDRPYKPPLPVETALRILREEAQAGKLDMSLVELFITEEIYKNV
jgi:HD-GYP domain-containing protein (c-di-GMP phosphodiesterase class II)